MSERVRRLVTVVAGTAGVACFSLLAVFAFLGLFVRPSADDWCVLWKTRDLGVLGITKDYYLTQNGRIANAFVSGLVSLDDSQGMRYFPAFLVAAFGLGLVLLLRRVWSMLGWEAPLPVLIAVAGVIELVLFAGAHDPYQAVLWLPGSISHTLPTVIAVWAVYFALLAGRSRRWWVRAVSVAGALLVGVVLGTLAEPALVMFGLLAATAGLMGVLRRRPARSWYTFLWCAAVCAGLVAGFAILYAAPGAQVRRGQGKTLSTMLSESLLTDAAGDWARIMHVVTSQWTYAAVLVAGVLLGTVTRPAGTHRRLPPAPVAVALLLTAPVLLAGSYLVVLGVRQGYGSTGWRDARIWFSYVAPMTLGLCAYGVLLGRALAHLLDRGAEPVREGVLALTTVLAGAVLLGGAAALLPVVEKQADFTIARARAFDAQDARIRAEVARGATEVVYRPLQVPALAEPNLRPGYPNFSDKCASDYYRVVRLLPPPKRASD
ncbi:DUF6056 family protein [Actinoplanes sp. NPDC049596]|uniref:DUF6056 family protein n=1 Tax=unclassified Actinoplanes TaxID=2626549 RepID=UPI00341899DB